jgi:hypothetical protein
MLYLSTTSGLPRRFANGVDVCKHGCRMLLWRLHVSILHQPCNTHAFLDCVRAVLLFVSASNTTCSAAAVAVAFDVHCRYLTWESDDLSSQGPVLDAFTHFTVLRLLSLSCTSKTLSNACGSRAVFQELMPYCDLDLIGSN